MSNLLIPMNLAEIRTLVFKQKPQLGLLYKKYKNKTWIDYGKENFPNSPLPNSKKTDELITVFKKLLVPLVGAQKADRAAHTLRTTGFVSTADHNSILCHPFFLNSTLLRTYPHFNNNILITLSCGGISLSNSSYPRGIFYHNAHLSRVRIPFIPLSDRHLPIYGHTPINKSIFLKHKNLFKPLLENRLIWKQKTLTSQFTIINSLLLKNYINFEVEELVRQLLLEIHLNKKTTVYSLLFDSEMRKKYIKSYDGVTGAHTRKIKGSHFFWFIDNKSKTRVQLWLDTKSNSLVSKNGSVSIAMKPDVIRRHLVKYELMPTMAFCYSILSFYYGLTLGGGFSQINYLGDMKDAYIKTVGIAEDVKTNVFTGEFVVIGLSNGIDIVPASFYDFLLWGGNNALAKVHQIIDTATVGESLDAMLPEFASIIDKHIVCRKVSNTKIRNAATAATTPSITRYIASKTEWSASGNHSRS